MCQVLVGHFNWIKYNFVYIFIVPLSSLKSLACLSHMDMIYFSLFTFPAFPSALLVRGNANQLY